MTSHLLLVPWSRKSRSYTSTPPVGLRACTEPSVPVQGCTLLHQWWFWEWEFLRLVAAIDYVKCSVNTAAACLTYSCFADGSLECNLKPSLNLLTLFPIFEFLLVSCWSKFHCYNSEMGLQFTLLSKWSHTSDSQKASLYCIPDTNNTSLSNYVIFYLHIDADDMASVLST